MTSTVGIVGLGIIGGAIARNLLPAGFAVRGYDIDAARLDVLKPNGIATRSAGEAAQGAEIVLTSLPSIKALDDTVASLLAAKASGLVVAELSTLPIAAKEKARAVLAGSGITLLDCPLSGTGAQAVTRDLVVFASGERAAVERCARVFDGFARLTHYLGAFGNGSRMKFIANLLVAIHNVASAEAMVLGMRAGLAAEDIVKVISSGAGNSRVFELRAPLMAKGAYQPATMKIDIWQKDMAVIGDFAKSLGVALPLFSATVPIYNGAVGMGLGNDDTAAVCAVLEAMAGVERG